MKLKTREVYGAVIVNIEGQLVGGPNSEIFRRFVGGLLHEGKKRIIVNLRNVPWANSQGVGMLIGALTSAKNAGGELVLSNVTDKIHSILSVTRLLMLFTTFDTVDEAVEYLRDLERTPRTVQGLS
ncbi:MAG: STAS domain-containing protein [Candidatus Latescibacterota bacterium]|nr:MAG: STAS domain-containing protein [Candidatus Latescibacterota bacterium]